MILSFLVLLHTALDTLKQPSIPLSPGEHTRNLKLDAFPFVIPQHGCNAEV